MYKYTHRSQPAVAPRQKLVSRSHTRGCGYARLGRSMKALVQRVTRASVTVGDREVSTIGKGLCVLLGISKNDTQKEAEWMASKLLKLRVFNDPTTGKAWDKNVTEVGQEILCVSQFTLLMVLKGNKPDFHNAMESEKSQPVYENFLKMLGSQYKPEAIKGGEFGALMQVHIQNDGPITLHIESPQFPPPKERKLPASGRKGSTDSQKSSKASSGQTGPSNEASGGIIDSAMAEMSLSKN